MVVVPKKTSFVKLSYTLSSETRENTRVNTILSMLTLVSTRVVTGPRRGQDSRLVFVRKVAEEG